MSYYNPKLENNLLNGTSYAAERLQDPNLDAYLFVQEMIDSVVDNYNINGDTFQDWKNAYHVIGIYTETDDEGNSMNDIEFDTLSEAEQAYAIKKLNQWLVNVKAVENEFSLRTINQHCLLGWIDADQTVAEALVYCRRVVTEQGDRSYIG